MSSLRIRFVRSLELVSRIAAHKAGSYLFCRSLGWSVVKRNGVCRRIYDVMCGGDRREAIYRDDEDRKLFLATLSQAACAPDTPTVSLQIPAAERSSISSGKYRPSRSIAADRR